MDYVAQLRAAIAAVDPAALTVADRLALLDLAEASLAAAENGGGGASASRRRAV